MTHQCLCHSKVSKTTALPRNLITETTVEENISNLSHDKLKKAYLNLQIQFNALRTENSNLLKDLDKSNDAKKLIDAKNITEKVVESETKIADSGKQEKNNTLHGKLVIILSSLLCFSFTIIVMVLIMTCYKNKKNAQTTVEEAKVTDRRWNQRDITNEFMPKITEI